KIKVNVGLNAIRNSLNRGLSNNDNTNTSPIYSFAYTPGVVNLDSVDATGTYVRNPFNGGGSTVSNPFETFTYLRLNELVSRQIGNLSATWAAVSRGEHQISVTATGGLDRVQVSGDLFSPSFVQYEPNDGATLLGTAVRTEGNIFNYNLYVGGNWNYQPSANLSFTTTAGYSFESQYNRVLRDRARGLLPGVQTTNSGVIRDGSDSVYGDFRDMAWVANEQVLALNQRLTIAGGVRADRSSANGDRGKYYVFPRASASYRFTDLGDLFNEVKIRGGWARTGNRPRYGDRDVLLRTGTNVGGNATLVQATTAGNADIKPETLTEIEAGAEVTILHQRLQFEGTGYTRKITDLLLQPATIPSGGITNAIVNGGELSNIGVELGLSANAVQSHDVDLHLRATFTKNKQEIKSLPANVARFPAPGSFGAAFGRNFITPGGRTTWIWGNVPFGADSNPLPIGILVTD